MIRIRQIQVKEKNEIKSSISKKLKINESDIISLRINKESIDARNKPDIYFVYEVDVEVINEEKILRKNKDINIFKAPIEEYKFQIKGNIQLKENIVVVGSGPAGLFATYLLLENGYKVTLIERGLSIDDRIKKVEDFWNNNILDEKCNVQFGEGGAGTFSDGKLNTLTKDKFYRQKKVLKTFVECGAPKEILYQNKPHIGTDILRNVVVNMRKKIISMGGIVLFNTCLTNINIEDNKIKSIEVNNEKIINVDILVLAIGHSAKDTFEMLHNNGVYMQSKPFAVGVRIEHPQKWINESQYGNSKLDLPQASYKLTYNANNRGVYTFCMCPGGYVVNSSSKKGYLSINGMSNNLRDEENANSAIIVTISNSDFGNGVFDGFKYQEKLEKKAFDIASGKIPTQLYKDFKNNSISKSFGKIKPVIKGEYAFANIREIFDDEISNSLIEAIESFGKKIKNFNHDDAILSAVESRTSSPIRIVRNDFMCNVKGIYPIGEGAGYAGGITSSAVDGIKLAEHLATIYYPNNL